MKRENLLICPVYNEEETIREFYQSLRKHYPQDVLFVDDGSTDRGRDFLLHIRGANTFVIRYFMRCGYGEALTSGFKFALDKGYKRIVTIDVDLQHNPEHIPSFFRELLNADVVLGSRYIRIGRCLDIPRERLLINRYISGLLKILFSFNFTDPFCGYRGYRYPFLKKTNLKENSYGLSLELLLEIIRTNANFKEIPIEAIYFNNLRKFLDGLDDPRKRLLYYLEIISKKRREIRDEEDEEEIFSGKSSS